MGILQNQRRATARLTGRAPVYKQFTHGVALVGTPQHPRKTTPQRGLVATRWPPEQHTDTPPPTANRASTPVDARARTRNHPSHPAKTVPDMDRVTRYVMRKSADFGQFGVRNSSPTHADAPAAAPASKPTISPHRR